MDFCIFVQENKIKRNKIKQNNMKAGKKKCLFGLALVKLVIRNIRKLTEVEVRIYLGLYRPPEFYLFIFFNLKYDKPAGKLRRDIDSDGERVNAAKK